MQWPFIELVQAGLADLLIHTVILEQSCCSLKLSLAVFGLAGNECLLLCVNTKKHPATAVPINFCPTNGSRNKIHFTMNARHKSFYAKTPPLEGIGLL